MQYTIKIKGEAVTFSGHQAIKGIKVVARNQTHVVLRVPGHKYWSSLGAPRSYAKAETKVFTILSETETNGAAVLTCVQVISYN